jgi:hypothetical protein
MSQIVYLWLMLRVLSGLMVSWFSSLSPITEIEKRLALWPPGSDLPGWFTRVFLAPWQRWDANWFVKILNYGYKSVDGAAQFHPLFLLLAKGLSLLGLNPLLSLLAVSSLSGLGFLLIFEKLARLDSDQEQARLSTIFLLFFPVSIVLFAPYTEGTFLLFAALCLYWSRKRFWWLAGLSGALASLTRQQGILLFIPMAWELWNDSKSRNIKASHQLFKKELVSWLSLILIPFGYGAWILFRSIVLDDVRIKFSGFQNFMYSFLISPSSSDVVPIQEFTWPWIAFRRALFKLQTTPDVDIWVNFVGLILFFILLVLAWRYLRPSYLYLVLASLFVSISYYTGPSHPYMGLLRHCYLGFPIFIVFPQIFQRKWQRLLLFSIFSAGWLFLLLLFCLEAWVL